MSNQADEHLTTDQAARFLGVRADTVRAMKTAGHLVVVGKGAHGANLFARRDVEAVKLRRGRPRVPAQQGELPSLEDLTCDQCRSLRQRVKAAEEREEAALQRAQAAEERAQRALAALTAAVG
ncbi:helix-turn-helix domain-containing protein [Streptomyces sp. NPDC090306]|uniref:helix-turn-helix domain-containing protein n=1 Tax=Streptomyces sp. NPDC090306 TaxID=3365961 RepID=UPI0037F33A68